MGFDETWKIRCEQLCIYEKQRFENMLFRRNDRGMAGVCGELPEHEFDIVDGPMADDQIWDYVEDYMTGNISKEALKTLHFEGSEKL